MGRELDLGSFQMELLQQFASMSVAKYCIG